MLPRYFLVLGCWIQLLLACVLLSGSTLAALAAVPAPATTGQWTAIGPHQSITAFAIDPNNEQIIYAGGHEGLWKTINGGASWTAVSGTAFFGPRLIIDPFSSTTLYAIDAERQHIIKSSDAGATWTVVFAVEPRNHISDLLAVASKTVILYAALSYNSAQIARSMDGGATWFLLGNPVTGIGDVRGNDVTGLATLPGYPNTLYASVTGDQIGFLLKTSEAGTVPAPRWSVLAKHPLGTTINALVASGNEANRSLYSSWVAAGQGNLFRNDNDGDPVELGASLPLQYINQTSSIMALAVNPAQPDWLYAAITSNLPGNLAVFASADRGQTWERLGQPFSLDRPVHGLIMAVRSHTLYAATDRGLYTLALQWPVAGQFDAFYRNHDGLRLLGQAISTAYTVNGFPAQYFEKGRLEDHQRETNDPNWRYMYGLLVDELQQQKSEQPIGGDSSTLNYAGLHDLADPSRRLMPSCLITTGCPDGTFVVNHGDGSVFVPFSADLKYGPGHIVLAGFWNYINDPALFPGGWLHDVGLPITEPQQVMVTKNLPGGPVQRVITVQAFQRTILTYDPANPPDWQIERANVGTDYRLVFPDRVGP